MRRIHRQQRAPRRQIAAPEHLAPRLPAVRGLVDAALVAIAPQLSRHAHVHRVGLGRIDEDFDDVFRVPEPHVRPILAAIVRAVDSVADRHAVAHPRLARAHPDHLGILRIDRHGADGLHRLLVEHRLEGRATVRRLPHAATRRADIDREPRSFMHGIDRRDAPAHRGRADVARAQARNRFRIHFDRGLLGDQEQQENVHGRAPGRVNRAFSSETFASILS